MALSALPLFHRVAGSRVVVLGDGPAAEAKRRLVERAGGECCGEPEAHHARLAFVAVPDARAAEAAAIRLRCKGLLVNVTDRPELCDFTVPSVLERDPVLVAVGTAGASAGLAKQLRLRLEALLPQSLGALAQALHAARIALRGRLPDAAERRRALDGAMAPGGPLDPLRDHPPGSVEAWLTGEHAPAAPGEVEAWLAGEPAPAKAGEVELVLASGDPDDLTLRQARLLGEADAVVLEGDIPEAILARVRADAERIAPSAARPAPNGLVVRIRRSLGPAK